MNQTPNILRDHAATAMRLSPLGRTTHERDRETADTFTRALVGDSMAMRQLRDHLRALVAGDSSAILLGPSGSGKELAARAIHAAGPRAGRPFVAVNIAAIPPTLLESELFGHEAGAFTGASRQHIGCLESAGDGVLFLDEIGDMPLDAQSRLLRVLEGRCFRRLGGYGNLPFAARIIAATHCNLVQMVDEGRFRRDLWFRLAVLPVRLPPLAERTRDLPQLVLALARELGVDVRFSDAAMLRLMRHDWPGNVRELRNVVARAALLPNAMAVGVEDMAGLLHPLGDAAPASGHDARMAAVERTAILAALGENDGVVAAAARQLGLCRSTLQDRMRRHGIGRQNHFGQDGA